MNETDGAVRLYEPSKSIGEGRPLSIRSGRTGASAGKNRTGGMPAACLAFTFALMNCTPLRLECRGTFETLRFCGLSARATRIRLARLEICCHPAREEVPSAVLLVVNSSNTTAPSVSAVSLLAASRYMTEALAASKSALLMAVKRGQCDGPRSVASSRSR